MRNLIISEFITLDGVIQAPGGPEEDTDGGFTHGGWTIPYWDDAIGAHFFEAMTQADTLLLGRKTWEIHGGAFDPMPDDDPFGGAMNTVRKYVVSTTLTSTALWRNSTIISGNVVEAVRKLKQAAGQKHPARRQQRPRPHADRKRSGGRIRAPRLSARARRRQTPVP